jgi:hypothetical protein
MPLTHPDSHNIPGGGAEGNSSFLIPAKRVVPQRGNLPRRDYLSFAHMR